MSKRQSWVVGRVGSVAKGLSRYGTWAPDDDEPLQHSDMAFKRGTWDAGELKSLIRTEPYLKPSLLGHRIACYFEKKIKAYGEHASVDDAWAYFENIRLPRRSKDSDSNFTKAPPGTVDSTLYPVWSTPQKQLNEFGTGTSTAISSLKQQVLNCYGRYCCVHGNAQVHDGSFLDCWVPIHSYNALLWFK